MKKLIEIEKHVIIDYNKGINNKELTIKYGISRSTVQSMLKRNGIVLRRGCEVAKKYDINENFFEKIDTQNKAYILGLIYADGNIYHTTLQIRLISTDKEILEKIGACLYKTGEPLIKYVDAVINISTDGIEYKSKPQYNLLITRKKITDDLRNLGLMENKTFKINVPKLDEELYRHFIRGYFDGDGCFFVSKKYKNNNRVNITSNKNFIRGLSLIINDKLGINCKISKTKTKNISVLSVYGNKKVMNFLNWIYEDSNLKLNRKYEKYIEVMKNKNNISELTIS